MQRSHAPAISSGSWVMMRTVFSFRISRISAAHRSRLSASCPAVGSSSMTIGLSDRYAIISVRRCICPPEREKGCRLRQSHISILFSSASVFASNSGVTACPYCSSCRTEPVKNWNSASCRMNSTCFCSCFRLRLSEKHYPAAGGAVKPCNQLADGGLPQPFAPESPSARARSRSPRSAARAWTR